MKTALTNLIPGLSTDERDDAIAKNAVFKDTPTYVSADTTMGTDPSTVTDATRRFGGVLGGLFTGSAWLSTFMAFLHMTSALLMVQALILMAIYMLLPLIVLLSGYKLEVMFYGAMAIFTVKFWTVLWFIAQWVDSNLVNAMYPSQTLLDRAMHFFQGSAGKKMILDILLFGMYIGFPLIWSGMMTWVGIQVGTVLSNMMKQNSQPARNNTGMSPEGVVGKFNMFK